MPDAERDEDCPDDDEEEDDEEEDSDMEGEGGGGCCGLRASLASRPCIGCD